MAIYEITAPNGQVLEIEGDTPPTEADLDEIFKTTNTAKEPTRPRKGLFNYTNEDLKADYQNLIDKRKEWEQNHPFISNLQKDFQPGYRSSLTDWKEKAKYGVNAPFKESLKNQALKMGQDAIPATNLAVAAATEGTNILPNLGKGLLPQMGRGAVQGLIQGGTLGATHELGDNGLSLNVIPETLKGAALGLGIGTIAPPVLAGGGAVLSKSGELLKRGAGKLAQISPETVEQVIRPTSKALDYTKEKAQDVLRSTTERVRDAYNNLLKQRGEAITTAEENLRNIPQRVNADDVISDIRGTFDQYQGENINPARNMTGDLEQNLINLVNSGRPIVDIDTSLLPEFTGNKNAYNKAIKDLYKQNVQGKKIIHPQSGPINFYKSGAGKTIYENPQDFEQLSLLPQIDEIVQKSKYQYNEPLNKIRKDDITNFDILKGRANINGDMVDTNIHIANTPDGKKFYFNKNSDIETSALLPYGNQLPISDTNIITDNEAYFNSLSPIDLQKLKQQVGQMTNWQDTTRPKIQNTVLEQVYGKMRNRLEDLSPELAQANKDFAALKGFQNDEGLKTILAPGGAIDRASTALKNYNSTVSKGNTAQNIQALEDVLVKNGEQPFLNTMDDINAAMDLLKQEKTGLGSIAELGKSIVTRPALKLARAYNRSPLPRTFGNVKNAFQRVTIPLIFNAPRLYGGVNYEDEYLE